MTKNQRLRRKAASRVFFAAFHAQTTIYTTLMSFPHQEWGDDLFTDAERAYLDRVKNRLHKDAILLRSFAWRLER